MYFKDDHHEFMFEQLGVKIRKEQGESKEYRAALYCLAATGKPVQGHIDSNGISFDKLLKEATKWSSAERALTRLAVDLFNGSGKATVSEVFSPLDEDNFKVAIEALHIRYN